MGDRVASVREFNRFYTSVIGVLDEQHLQTPYSLSEARVIYELGRREWTEVADLRRELALDGGYLSRILARFEADGLVSRRRSDTDRRRQVIRLTDAGVAARQTLDTRADAEIGRLLDGLSDADQRRVVDAMSVIRELMGESARQRAVVLREPGPGDLGWVVAQHGALYSGEYGWDASFEALAARIVADFAERHDPARERAWIADVDGRPVGCVFCVRGDDDRTAQLRLLLVTPGARGCGVGAALVEECQRYARRAGYTAMTLWTNDVLLAARRIYERAGFELVSSEPHHSFGTDLVGQYWSCAL